jgi:choline transporter-like protein 2/4/5
MTSAVPYEKAKDGESRPHPTVGINAQRECNDLWAWLLLIIGVALIIATANTAFSIGKPMRLILGSDYLGNICGKDDPAPSNLTVSDWSRRTLLWYPVTFDYRTKKLLTSEALDLGVCVSRCPAPFEVVQPYGFKGGSQPPPWLVLFNSTPQYYRCMPLLFTFNCQNDSSCLSTIASSNTTFSSAAALGGFANEAMNEVRLYFWTIYVGVAISLVLCFVWMILLRNLLTYFVKFSLFLLFAVLLGIAILFFALRAQRVTAGDAASADWFLAGGVIAVAVVFGYLIVLWFLWNDIMTSCDIIEEATRVPTDIPTLIVLPPATLFWALCFASFAVVLAVFIQASSENLELSVPVPSYINTSNTGSVGALLGNNSRFNLTTNGTFTAVNVNFPNWRPYAHIYNLFFFLWAFGLLNAICFQCVALCTVFWYFSNPGNNKTPPLGAVMRAFWIVMRYHIGTLAFGSLIVAIIQTVRVILAIIEYRLKQTAGKDNTAVTLMLRCAQCCLACLECVVNFVNKNAYIVQAVEGLSFFPAARMAMTYLGENVGTVGSLSIITNYVMLFTKLIVTGGTVIASYFIISAAGAASGVTGGVILLFIIAVLSFFVACLFANLFEVCIDSMLICYCFDKHHKEDPVNYYPPDLAARVEKVADKRNGVAGGAPDVAAAGARAEPMKERVAPPLAAPGTGVAPGDDFL